MGYTVFRHDGRAWLPIARSIAFRDEAIETAKEQATGGHPTKVENDDKHAIVFHSDEET